MRAFAYLATLALVAGCGGDEGITNTGDMSTVPDMAKTTPPPDIAVPPDLAMPPPADMAYNPPKDADGVGCGNMQCQVGEVCCVSVNGMQAMTMCAQSCPDGGVAVTCDGPEDCMGNPCCAKLSGGGLGGVMCTMAQNACPPQFDIQQMMGQTRLCHVDGDCTAGAPNTNLPLCCTVKDQNGNAAHICLNKQFAAFAGGSCP